MMPTTGESPVSPFGASLTIEFRCLSRGPIVTQRYDQMDTVETSAAIARRAGSLAELPALRGNDAVHLGSDETLASADGVFVAGDGSLCRATTALGKAVGPLT
jgi:hypothetical protein